MELLKILARDGKLVDIVQRVGSHLLISRKLCYFVTFQFQAKEKTSKLKKEAEERKAKLKT